MLHCDKDHTELINYLLRLNGQVHLTLVNEMTVRGEVAEVLDDCVCLTNVVLKSSSQKEAAFAEYRIDINQIIGCESLERVCDPPQFCGFRKITPVNGFDSANRDNAKQNNYAWSIAELGDYIYVGTARNIAYSILSSQLLGNIPVPSILVPQNPDPAGEIWRYKKDGSQLWQRVYKAAPLPVNIGFRVMINFKNALYAGGLTPFSSNLSILKSTDGEKWTELTSGIEGYSSRAMTEYNGRLYMGALPLMGVAEAALFVSDNPETGWQKIDLNGTVGKNPSGNIDLLFSFNGFLYVGTALPTGFSLWRTKSTTVQKDDWVLVVDQGAGDARNEHPWAAGIFDDAIYIGTAIEVAVRSINPDDPIVSPKGFDLIRVNKEDQWELIVGGDPVVPTQPTTGTRGAPLSGFASGFGDLTNGYCWQIQAFNNELYLGTWSWNDFVPLYVPYIPLLLASLLPPVPAITAYLDYLRALLGPTVTEMLYTLGYRQIGCDLWKSSDGIHWAPVSLNGLGNRYNYGIRELFLASDNTLYIGTANPFQGCEVWVKKGNSEN